MWQYTPTNELMHYGKKGMKWGQRRAVKKQAKALKNLKLPGMIMLIRIGILLIIKRSMRLMKNSYQKSIKNTRV